MEKDLGNYRKSYESGKLLLKESPQDPMELFEVWFNEVDHYFPDQETNAMTISTIGLDGYPKNRIVLLKKYSNEGFIFYTNYNSEKGKAIGNNPNVCLSFFWEGAERQVIVKGLVKKITKEESIRYFESRPRGSQLGAIVSNQSDKILNREVLEKNLKDLEKNFKEKKIDKPEHWGGYIVEPFSIEFWQGRKNRLHDRVLYERTIDLSWVKSRLSP